MYLKIAVLHTLVSMGHLYYSLYYMELFQAVISDHSVLICPFANSHVAFLTDRCYLADRLCKLELGLGSVCAQGDLAIAATSEITPNLSSQKEVWKLGHAGSHSQ